jgi:hypothetical protein
VHGIPADLAEVNAAWNALPEAVRAGIVTYPGLSSSGH